MPKRSVPESPQPEAPQPETPPGPAPHSHRFFTWIRSLGLVRQPGWIGGVSAGIADRIGIDVLVVRGILVVIALLGGPAVLLYALAWLVLPDATGRIHLEDLVHGKVETPVVGIAILVALSLLPVAQGFWWFGSYYWGAPQWGGSVGRALWTLVVLGALIWFVVWFSRRRDGNATATRASARTTTASAAAARTDVTGTSLPEEVASEEPVPPPAPPTDASVDEVAAWRAGQEQWKADHDAYRRRQLDERRAAARAASEAAQAERAARANALRERARLTRSHPLYSIALIGTALVAGAISTLALGAGTPDAVDWLAGAAVAVGVLGLGIIVNGALGRRSGGASGVAVILAVVLLLAGVFPQTQSRHYFGPLNIAPTQSGGRNSEVTYLEGFGSVNLDLTSYYSAPRAKGSALRSYDQVNLVVVSGNVTVKLPAGEYLYLAAGTADGHITTTGGTVVHGEYHAQVRLPEDTSGDRATRTLEVDIHALHGNITFIEETNQ